MRSGTEHRVKGNRMISRMKKIGLWDRVHRGIHHNTLFKLLHYHSPTTNGRSFPKTGFHVHFLVLITVVK